MCVPSGSWRVRGSSEGTRCSQVFPRVPDLLFGTASSLNLSQGRGELPYPRRHGHWLAVLGGSRRKHSPRHSHVLSQLSSMDPLSHARTLPSLPRPASPPLLARGEHRASLMKAWVYGCCQKQQFEPSASIHLPAPFALTPSHHLTKQRQTFPWKRMQHVSMCKGHSETDTQTPQATAKHMGTSRRNPLVAALTTVDTPYSQLFGAQREWRQTPGKT